MALPVTLAVIPGQQITGPSPDLALLVRATPPDGIERTPSDICCVIDISWSMSMEAKVAGAAGTVESNGLSMLDIAKHAVRTVIRTLGPKDRMAIVQFCREAQVVLPLTQMTEGGQTMAEERLDQLSFGNGTALWEGIKKGLEELKSGGDDKGRLSHIMLLTDGETEDKAHVMEKLRAFKMSNERLPGTINAFGFGYEIDSQLLVEIANFSDGSYAFIPDAGFVGTCFVNSMSNLLVTMARDAILTLQADSGTRIIEVLGWPAQPTFEGVHVINFGSLQYGQTKDVVVRVSVASAVSFCASLSYSTTTDRHTVAASSLSQEAPGLVEAERCRCSMVAALNGAVEVAAPASEEALEAARGVVKAAAAAVSASPSSGTEQVAGLLEDVLGQSSEAISRVDYWQKWGRHYIPSVASAHRLQQCNNFKDPGVQVYGGKLFSELRDVADAAFDSLPAPKITPARYRYLGGGRVIHNPSFVDPARPTGHTTYTAPAPSVSMSAYNDRYAACIDGACSVRLASGASRPLAELAKGDLIAAGPGGDAEVEVVCMVRSRCVGGRAALADLEVAGGRRLRLTPHHPVQWDGQWRFPCELGATEERDCPAVYSFVLRGAPAAIVEGVPCAALGHGLAEGAAAHEYFASSRVLEDLAAFPGYAEGLVDLLPGNILRDPDTGLVCRLQPARI